MKRLSFATALLFSILSCQKKPFSGAVEATFHDATGLSGCGMVIELPDGKYIEPSNLEDFPIIPQDEGEIWVSYHLKEAGGSICMIGDVVIIDRITTK
ncbi:MAG: hypothetical protein AB8B56_01330 [Crocinitomicaceae bacterium]